MTNATPTAPVQMRWPMPLFTAMKALAAKRHTTVSALVTAAIVDTYHLEAATDGTVES